LELGQEAFVVAKRAYIASRIKLAQLQKVAKTITRDATEFPALLSAATEAVAISRAAYDRALAEIQSVNPNFARDDDTSSGVVNEMPNPLNRLRKLTRLLVLAGALVYPSSLDTAKNNDHISVASVTTGNSADWFKQNITPLSAPALATENGGVESVPGVVLRNPVLSDEGAANPPFSQGAENIPTDPNITLPDMSLDPDTSLLATTVPQPNQVTLSSAESVSARPPQEGVTPQLTETEKTATTFAPVMSDLIEVRPVIDHVVVPGDNVTKLLKRYGTKQLAGLSDAEANTAIAKVIAKISATLELQEASGVGKNPDLIIASVSRPQVLHLTPLVAELEKIVHAEAMTQSPVSPQAEAEVVVPRTTVEATEAINATVVPSETATLAVSRESISPVRSVESEIMAYKASYPGGQKGLADFYDTQVEAIQGKHPKAYSGIFSIFSAGTEHTDAYNILKAMSVRAVRELSNLPISARLSRLGELALLPEDLAKWETQLRRWQMIPDLNQLDDSIPFGALAERAFVLEQINRPVTTIV
jgi:hypothetical protein